MGKQTIPQTPSPQTSSPQTSSSSSNRVTGGSTPQNQESSTSGNGDSTPSNPPASTPTSWSSTLGNYLSTFFSTSTPPYTSTTSHNSDGSTSTFDRYTVTNSNGTPVTTTESTITISADGTTVSSSSTTTNHETSTVVATEETTSSRGDGTVSDSSTTTTTTRGATTSTSEGTTQLPDGTTIYDTSHTNSNGDSTSNTYVTTSAGLINITETSQGNVNVTLTTPDGATKTITTETLADIITTQAATTIGYGSEATSAHTTVAPTSYPLITTPNNLSTTPQGQIEGGGASSSSSSSASYVAAGAAIGAGFLALIAFLALRKRKEKQRNVLEEVTAELSQDDIRKLEAAGIPINEISLAIVAELIKAQQIQPNGVFPVNKENVQVILAVLAYKCQDSNQDNVSQAKVMLEAIFNRGINDEITRYNQSNRNNQLHLNAEADVLTSQDRAGTVTSTNIDMATFRSDPTYATLSDAENVTSYHLEQINGFFTKLGYETQPIFQQAGNSGKKHETSTDPDQYEMVGSSTIHSNPGATWAAYQTPRAQGQPSAVGDYLSSLSPENNGFYAIELSDQGHTYSQSSLVLDDEEYGGLEESGDYGANTNFYALGFSDKGSTHEQSSSEKEEGPYMSNIYSTPNAANIYGGAVLLNPPYQGGNTHYNTPPTSLYAVPLSQNIAGGPSVDDVYTVPGTQERVTAGSIQEIANQPVTPPEGSANQGSESWTAASSEQSSPDKPSNDMRPSSKFSANLQQSNDPYQTSRL